MELEFKTTAKPTIVGNTAMQLVFEDMWECTAELRTAPHPLGERDESTQTIVLYTNGLPAYGHIQAIPAAYGSQMLIDLSSGYFEKFEDYLSVLFNRLDKLGYTVQFVGWPEDFSTTFADEQAAQAWLGTIAVAGQEAQPHGDKGNRDLPANLTAAAPFKKLPPRTHNRYIEIAKMYQANKFDVVKTKQWYEKRGHKRRGSRSTFERALTYSSAYDRFINERPKGSETG